MDRKNQVGKWVAFGLLVSSIFVVRAYKRAQSDAAQNAQQEAFLRSINPDYKLEPWQIQLRLEKQAQEGMLKEASNYAGFVRVVHSNLISPSDQSPTNWHGFATIDYVNKVGGVERTNLTFRIIMFQHDALVSLDTWAMSKRDERFNTPPSL